CVIPSPFAAELMGRAGYDWVCIDTQHGLIGYDQMLPMLQALSATGTPAFVRVAWNQPSDIVKALDAGAEGVVIPIVNPHEARHPWHEAGGDRQRPRASTPDRDDPSGLRAPRPDRRHPLRRAGHRHTLARGGVPDAERGQRCVVSARRRGPRAGSHARCEARGRENWLLTTRWIPPSWKRGSD